LSAGPTLLATEAGIIRSTLTTGSTAARSAKSTAGSTLLTTGASIIRSALTAGTTTPRSAKSARTTAGRSAEHRPGIQGPLQLHDELQFRGDSLELIVRHFQSLFDGIHHPLLHGLRIELPRRRATAVLLIWWRATPILLGRWTTLSIHRRRAAILPARRRILCSQWHRHRAQNQPHRYDSHSNNRSHVTSR
jgi:hypothetical protein